jgi:formylglycine-generating enzyme required for sulfatase activity
MYLEEFLAVSFDQRLRWGKAVEAALSNRFLLDWQPEQRLLPRFIDRETKTGAVLVPGGSFVMGLSEREEAAALRISDPIPANISEMRPLRRVNVRSLLIQEAPVLEELSCAILGLPVVRAKSYAWLTHSDATEVARRVGGRLLLEREWEYCCRSGTDTLFVFGETLPADEELDQWLASDFTDLSRVRANPFGLYGMFTGEWCADQFRATLEDDGPVIDGSHAVRGGATQFWPWQDEEWIWCASAMRMPSVDLGEAKKCAVRVAYEVPD